MLTGKDNKKERAAKAGELRSCEGEGEGHPGLWVRDGQSDAFE